MPWRSSGSATTGSACSDAAAETPGRHLQADRGLYDSDAHMVGSVWAIELAR